MGTLGEIYGEEFFEKLKDKMSGKVDKGKEEKSKKTEFNYDEYLSTSINKLVDYKKYNRETISNFSKENNCGLFIFGDAIFCFQGWYNGINNKEYFIERNMNMSILKVPTLIISPEKYEELQEKYKSQKKNSESVIWTPKTAFMAFDDVTSYLLDLNDHHGAIEKNYNNTFRRKKNLEFTVEDFKKLPIAGTLDYINDTYWLDLNDRSLGKRSTSFIPVCAFSHRSKTSIVHGKIMDTVKFDDGQVYYIVPLVFCNLFNQLGGYRSSVWSLV